MSGKEQRYLEETIASNWIAPLGPQVDRFEAEIAAYLGVRGALALNSGTAAMHLALLLAGAGKGDRIFCSALTFAATANPILYVEAEPVFIDSEPETWNISPAALERALFDAQKEKALPKAVIVVNLYGQSALMKPLLELGEKYGVALIEDAAESLGAIYRGKKSGSFGRFGILSFNGNKIITTSGGGALVSGDPEALKRARYLASQARQQARHYEHTEVGYNYRLSNLLAAVGRAQLEVIEERIAAKKRVNERYREALGRTGGFSFMPGPEEGRSTYWLTSLTVEKKKCGVSRDDLIEALENENIEARPVWKPMQLQPLYSGYRYYAHKPGESVSERLFEQGLCLPSGSSLTEEEQERVIEVIKNRLK